MAETALWSNRGPGYRPTDLFHRKAPRVSALLQPFFEAVERGDIEIVTSALTLTEVLVHPLRQGDMRLARQYSRILLNASHVKTLAISPAIAIEAAHLRASQGYKTPDVIQLATAQNGHARFFVTNDEALANTPGLQVLVLKHLFAQS